MQIRAGPTSLATGRSRRRLLSVRREVDAGAEQGVEVVRGEV